MKFTKPVLQLRAARKLITDKSQWTRGALARNQYGNPLKDPCSPNAVRWCSIGAIMAAADVHSEKTQDGVQHRDHEALQALIRNARVPADWPWVVADEGPQPGDRTSVIWVNDAVGHEAALAMLDAAIEELS